MWNVCIKDFCYTKIHFYYFFLNLFLIIILWNLDVFFFKLGMTKEEKDQLRKVYKEDAYPGKIVYYHAYLL